METTNKILIRSKTIAKALNKEKEGEKPTARA